MTPWSPSKLCDALDFFRPEIIEQIRRVGEEPRLHSKQWEYAQLLETRRRYAKDARVIVGLGCGCEATLPLVGEGADEVIATDLYGRDGAWSVARETPDRRFPQMRNLRVHSMDMREIDLPAGSADFVWALCAVEHVGAPDDVVRAVREAGRLLRPGGVFFLTSEFSLGPRMWRSGRTICMDRTLLQRLFTETGLHLVEPMDLRMSSHPMNTPVWHMLNDRIPALPHVTYRIQRRPFVGTYSACMSMALCLEDRGADHFIDDPGRTERLRPLLELGRKITRRLAPPMFWW